jgi:hypothetical protein
MKMRLIVSAAMSLAASSLYADVATTYSPAAFQEEAISSGFIASGGDFTTRIRYDGINQSRGVYEFYLPTLPNGGTYTGATINYTVNESSSSGAVSSQLQFFGYPGNGRYDVADVFQTFSSIGMSIQFTNGQLTTHSTPIDVSLVNGVHNANNNWFGVVAWQEQLGHSTGVGRGGPGTIIPRLEYAANVPGSGSLSTRPIFDTLATYNGATFDLSDGQFDVAINTQFIPDVVDRRAILEFHLGGLPDGAVITSASLSFDVAVLTTDPIDGGPEPRFFGFAGNGFANAFDALLVALPLATGSEVTALGPYTVDLDVTTLQSIFEINDLVGIVVGGSADGHQFAFDTLESEALLGGSAVTLNITYVPEPATMAVLPALGVLLLRRRRDGFH